jgi:L,D-transpeptidase YbiS
VQQHIEINIGRQTLALFDANQPVKSYVVSTAANGAGCLIGSERTPLGEHIIRAKIGKDCPLQAVFIGRRFTGEMYNAALARQFPQRDWILTRILWLSGCEVGKNRLGNVDSMRRYIYIHGTPDTEPMGVPRSHGCIRMRNDDIVQLFDRVRAGCAVFIRE